MEKQKKHWAEVAKLGAFAAVVDPNDKQGFKNRYIVGIRDNALLEFLPDGPIELLDFGCGTGNLSKSFASQQRRVTGIDISRELLDIAIDQNDPSFSRFLLYDGGELPLEPDSFHVATTYVVLNHITDDDELESALKNLHRVIKGAGRLICIEQTRRKSKLTYNGIKRQRSVRDFTDIFRRSGFQVDRIEHLRKGRFIGTYLVRYGLIPPRYYSSVAKVDRFFADLFPAPNFSYVDTLFVLKKSDVQDD